MIDDYNLDNTWLQVMGLEEFAKEQEIPVEKQEKKEKPILKEEKANFAVSQKIIPKLEKMVVSSQIADNLNNLEQLKEAIVNFEGCSLKFGAKNTVFAEGVTDSKIMLIGEAPGATEDEKGVPFCGESGKLLDNMLASVGISRHQNCYISNTVFWRPPANRAPTQEEIELCRPFVEKHIALIKPKLLILVGSTAVTSLLGNHLQISKIRQEYYQYTNKYLEESIATTALFHPAYLLRQPLQKKTSWYDLLKIKDYVSSKGIKL